MSTTHFYGDDCIPPHEEYEPDPVAKEELLTKLQEVEAKVTAAKAEQFDATYLALQIEQANVAYDEWCQQRHVEGGEKYGPVKFLEINSIEEAMAEVVDLGNYARYTFIRLYLMNHFLDQNVGREALGDNKFVFNRDKMGG